MTIRRNATGSKARKIPEGRTLLNDSGNLSTGSTECGLQFAGISRPEMLGSHEHQSDYNQDYAGQNEPQEHLAVVAHRTHQHLHTMLTG